MRLSIEVTPRARRARVEALADGALRVVVTAPARDGQANAAVIDALAAHFGVPRARIRIVRGHRGRRKLVDVAG